MRPSLAGLSLLSVLVWCFVGCGLRAPIPVADEILGKVSDFSLTERSGRTVRRADLHGKVWVAGFIFTRCSGACRQISATMSRLQTECAAGKDVLLVSFTVDPEYDTAKVLQDHAAQFKADPERWLFLTGNQDEVYRLIRESFMLGVGQNAGEARTPGNEAFHSSKLLLVDRLGQIRGFFEGRQVDEAGNPVDDLPRLKQRIAELLRERP